MSEVSDRRPCRPYLPHAFWALIAVIACERVTLVANPADTHLVMALFSALALAAALGPSSEATYKLGDMYSRGISGKPDLLKAKALWDCSFELAHDIAERAQPAIRIARLLIDPQAAKRGIEFDPLQALSLYQQAEIGLRIDITENGMTYYQKRLQEAIEGQAQARALLTNCDTEGMTLS